MKRGHIPLRTCKACGRRASKAELVRWIADQGEIVEDRFQEMTGRGVYCCPDEECRLRLLKNRKKLILMLRIKG